MRTVKVAESVLRQTHLVGLWDMFAITAWWWL
jgi:hypothetical protein